MYFRAKGTRARVHFPATYFLYFVARFAQTPSLFPVNIMKELRFTALSVEITDKKMEKSKFSVVKWSSRNEGFEDKKRRAKTDSPE